MDKHGNKYQCWNANHTWMKLDHRLEPFGTQNNRVFLIFTLISPPLGIAMHNERHELTCCNMVTDAHAALDLKAARPVACPGDLLFMSAMTGTELKMGGCWLMLADIIRYCTCKGEFFIYHIWVQNKKNKTFQVYFLSFRLSYPPTHLFSVLFSVNPLLCTQSHEQPLSQPLSSIQRWHHLISSPAD